MEHDLSGKRLLVTGGAGFIGSAFVRAALAAGVERLVVLDKLTYAAHPANLARPAQDPRFELVVGDVADAADCRAALAAARPDWVVHLAAESHVDRSTEDPAPFLRTNVLGTGVLLDACLEHLDERPAADRAGFRFLHSSTDEGFGELEGGDHAHEQRAYSPSSPYSATKAAADHLVRAYGRTYGLPWILTHSGNNYGPRQFPEKLVPLALGRLLAGEPVPLYGDGEHERDWIHVEDHCRALLAAGLRGAPGRAYCVSAGEVRSNRELVELLRGVCEGGEAGSVEFVADRPGHDRRYALDPARLREETGWTARTGLAEGLAATVRWYRDHPEWVAEARERSGYRGERLGLGRRPGRRG